MTRIHHAVSHQNPRKGAIWLLLALTIAARVSAVEAIKSYPTMTLKDGRQFAAVVIVNYTTNGVLVRHAQGATTIRLEALPEYVIAALHLQGWQNAPSSAPDLASLADKPAVTDLPAIADTAALDIADRPAVAETATFAAKSDTPASSADSNRPDFSSLNDGWKKFT